MEKNAFYPSQLGLIRVGYEGECLTALSLEDMPFGENCPSDFSDRVFREVSEYFAGERFSFDIPYRLEGSEFEKKVLTALTGIPYGEVVTYGDIAARIGSPRSFRAVGNACGKNRLMLVIPCHRVVGKGNLGGYGGRLDRKEFLLDLEYNNLIAKQGT